MVNYGFALSLLRDCNHQPNSGVCNAKSFAKLGIGWRHEMSNTI